MNIGSLAIEHEPGQTYREPPFGQQRTAEEAAHERAEGRQRSVEQFRKAGQASTRGQLAQAVAQVIGLTIQLRALGGSAADTGLGDQLREAADFLEDL